MTRPHDKRIATALTTLLVLLGFFFEYGDGYGAEVGYRRIEIEDREIGRAFPVAIWYPTDEQATVQTFGAYTMRVARGAAPVDTKLGLIVVSHGSGGDGFAHYDLAIALASHGYVVAAPTHPLDNYRDMSGVGSADVWSGRPRQVSRVIDRLLDDATFSVHIDRARIGVVGHSAGGYTALAVAGARPNMRTLVEHCRSTPEDARLCAFGGAPARAAVLQGGEVAATRDPRVRAIVLLAPVGALFTNDALSEVAVPVRVYGAERDDLTPVKYHAARIAHAVRGPAEYVLVPGAGHYSFIATYPDRLKALVGEAAIDPPGFDRDALHERLNTEIAEFFNRSMK